jgi:hypothetical protein
MHGATIKTILLCISQCVMMQLSGKLSGWFSQTMNKKRSSIVRRGRCPSLCPLQIQPASFNNLRRLLARLFLVGSVSNAINRLSTETTSCDSWYQNTHTLLSALETSLSTATVLAPFVARIGNLSTATEKLYHIIILCPFMV